MQRSNESAFGWTLRRNERQHTDGKHPKHAVETAAPLSQMGRFYGPARILTNMQRCMYLPKKDAFTHGMSRRDVPKHLNGDMASAHIACTSSEPSIESLPPKTPVCRRDTRVRGFVQGWRACKREFHRLVRHGVRWGMSHDVRCLCSLLLRPSAKVGAGEEIFSGLLTGTQVIAPRVHHTRALYAPCVPLYSGGDAKGCIAAHSVRQICMRGWSRLRLAGKPLTTAMLQYK